MVFLPNLCANPRCCLCGIARCASVQQFAFLDLGQKSVFVNWKRHQVIERYLADLWTCTNYYSAAVGKASRCMFDDGTVPAFDSHQTPIRMPDRNRVVFSGDGLYS